MFNTPKIAIFFVSAAFSALTLAAATAPAWAQELQIETVTRHVRAGDLDLATASGQAALARRVTVAARQVCDEAMEDALLADISSCVAAAKQRAVQQIADDFPPTVHRGGAQQYAAAVPAR